MILTIDSSALVASVALADKEVIIAEYTMNLKRTHSQTILPMIDEMFKMTGVNKADLKAIAVTNGPGSFTGLRIGAATAKGIALAQNIPVIGVSTLKTMAYNFNYCNRMICPMLDARRNHVFTGLYKCETTEVETIIKDTTLPKEKMIEKINIIGEPVIFIGDGVELHRNYIEENINVEYHFGKQHVNRQRAASLAAIAYDKLNNGEIENADTFAPNYLRMSQAERERMEKIND